MVNVFQNNNVFSLNATIIYGKDISLDVTTISGLNMVIIKFYYNFLLNCLVSNLFYVQFSIVTMQFNAMKMEYKFEFATLLIPYMT